MCVVSAIGDYTNREWEKKWPTSYPSIPSPFDGTIPPYFPDSIQRDTVSKKEFDELKAEVIRIRELLEAAVKFDQENSEPHCEMENKVAILKKVADFVGVDLKDIFGEETKKTPKIVIGPPVTSSERGFYIKGEFMNLEGELFNVIIDRWHMSSTIEMIKDNLLEIVDFLECAINDPDELENHDKYYDYITNFGYFPHETDDSGCIYMQLESYQVVWCDEHGQEFEVLIGE